MIASSPQFEKREAQVDVYREMPRADFIEYRPPTVLVRALAEFPGELRPLTLMAQWISQSNPAASGYAVHDHATARLAEEERLVAKKRQVCDRVRAVGGDSSCDCRADEVWEAPDPPLRDEACAKERTASAHQALRSLSATSGEHRRDR